MSAAAEKQSSSRLLAVGIFVGLPALLLALSVLNLLQVADDQYSRSEKELQLAAFNRRLSAPSPDGKPLDLTPIYISSTSRSLASATLQQYLVDSIAATSGRVIETASLDSDTADDPERADDIRLKATLDIDNPGLLQLLYKLESGVPLLDVETLSVRNVPDTAGEDNANILRIDVAVRGQWRRSAP